MFGLRFPNLLGVAAGFDKDARVVTGLALLGFGHVEIGTLTPKRQEGNRKPRIRRLLKDRALINHMGFPNRGVDGAVDRLSDRSVDDYHIVVGASLGKQKKTDLAEAVEDYVAVMRAIYLHVDYLVINISSPNTPGLRELQHSRYLSELLERMTAENVRIADLNSISPRPLLVKISPDLSWQELDEVLNSAVDHGISGIVATNTTIRREGIVDFDSFENGGLSGRPIATRSNAMIAYINKHLGEKMPVIGVGGVFNANDVGAKLDAGASLVQTYTGLVYEGPGMAGRTLRAL